MTADADLRRAWAAYTLRFADPHDVIRHSETKVRDAFAAGWDAALAARSEPRAEGLTDAEFVAELRADGEHELADGVERVLRSEPRAEGLGENDVRGHFPYHEYPHPTDHTHVTPPAEGLDVERLARAYAEAGYGGVLSDEEWQDIAREYAALAPEQPE